MTSRRPSAAFLVRGLRPAHPTGSRPDIRRVLAADRLPALDGLRAVAVFLVIFSHSALNSPGGDLGVSAFFVLSGFLITWLLLKEHAASGTISLRRFYLRRTLRIFPAYYAFLAFSISVDLFRGDSRIRPVIGPALAYLVNYYNALHGHPINSITHAWSLALEEQFYLLWPLGFLLLARHSRRACVVGLLLAIGAVVTWRCIGYYGLNLGTAYAYNAFDTRFDNLAIGCLLAVLSERSWFAGFAKRVTSSPFLPVFTLVGLLISRVLAPSSYHYGPGFTVDAVLVALFIVQMLLLHPHWMWRWLEHPVVRYLGTISYPLYLYHLWGLGLGRLAGGSGPRQFVTGVLLAVLMASASYFLIEKRFLALKRRFENRTAPQRTPPGTLAPTLALSIEPSLLPRF